ncbi:hypothetical protein GCM10023188_15660 [Pontibacter saemangeumensis]|uniref:Uncharacterized protein n=1 Tax=Pontibacter saemangeumensis TaxID=1084525 RepID=A0ABP8LIR0_9BACT
MQIATKGIGQKRPFAEDTYFAFFAFRVLLLGDRDKRVVKRKIAAYCLQKFTNRAMVVLNGKVNYIASFT